jgi:hypothetical protein
MSQPATPATEEAKDLVGGGDPRGGEGSVCSKGNPFDVGASSIPRGVAEP